MQNVENLLSIQIICRILKIYFTFKYNYAECGKSSFDKSMNIVCVRLLWTQIYAGCCENLIQIQVYSSCVESIQDIGILLQIHVYAARVLQVYAACGKSTLDSSMCCMCIASILCRMWNIYLRYKCMAHVYCKYVQHVENLLQIQVYAACVLQVYYAECGIFT